MDDLTGMESRIRSVALMGTPSLSFCPGAASSTDFRSLLECFEKWSQVLPSRPLERQSDR